MEKIRIGIRGDIFAQVVSSQGDILQTINSNNLVVDRGLNRLTTLSGLSESTGSGFVFSGIGTDNSAPAAGDLACGAEVDRVANTFNYISDGIYNASSSHTGLVATISEICLHGNDSASGGDPLGHATFSPATLTAVDTLKVRYTISFAAV